MWLPSLTRVLADKACKARSLPARSTKSCSAAQRDGQKFLYMPPISHCHLYVKARQLSHTLRMVTLIIATTMVLAITTANQSSAIQTQVLLPSSGRTKTFYQHREEEEEEKDKELPVRKMFGDYGTWDPAPYFGGGGYPAPIPHEKVK